MSKIESDFQASLEDDLHEKFPGCFIHKLDPDFCQGVPDLLFLYKDKWALLEVKRSKKEREKPRPNQEYYVNKFNNMSFSRFIYPENKEEVIDEMERTFKS